MPSCGREKSQLAIGGPAQPVVQPNEITATMTNCLPNKQRDELLIAGNSVSVLKINKLKKIKNKIIKKKKKRPAGQPGALRAAVRRKAPRG